MRWRHAEHIKDAALGVFYMFARRGCAKHIKYAPHGTVYMFGRWERGGDTLNTICQIQKMSHKWWGKGWWCGLPSTRE